MHTQSTTTGGSLLSVSEVALRLGVSAPTIYREIQRKALPAVYVGAQLRIRPVDLVQYLERGRRGDVVA